MKDLFRLLVNVCIMAAGSIVVPCNAEKPEERFECGGFIFHVEDVNRDEAETWLISIRDKDSKLKFPQIISAGRFAPLCSTEEAPVFVLYDRDVQHPADSSCLMKADPKSLTPRVIATCRLGEIARFGVAPDKRIFWVQTFVQDRRGRSVPDDGKWATRLRVIDRSGKSVLDKLHFQITTETVEYAGDSYEIDVREPDAPG